MKDLIVTLVNKDLLPALLDADSFLVGNDDFGVRLAASYSLKEIEELRVLTKKYQKNLYINVNKLFSESEIAALTSFLEFLKTIDVDAIFFSDMAVFMIAKKLDMIDRLVYYSETTLVNYLDAQILLNLKIKGIIYSKEMTLEDMVNSAKINKNQSGMLVHGYYHMFYSKRKLLRNYFDKYQLNGEYYNRFNLSLKEMTRDDFFPIVENQSGTNIFSKGCLTSLNDFNLIKESNLHYLIIDGIFLSEKHLIRVLHYYRLLLNNGNDNYEEKLKNEFKDVTFIKGFLFHKIGFLK